jgi:hypothetical protein
MAEAGDRKVGEQAGHIEPHVFFKGSDADVQEQERPWEVEEPDEVPEVPEHLGIETPEADALEQTRSWGPEEESERRAEEASVEGL